MVIYVHEEHNNDSKIDYNVNRLYKRIKHSIYVYTRVCTCTCRTQYLVSWYIVELRNTAQTIVGLWQEFVQFFFVLFGLDDISFN